MFYIGREDAAYCILDDSGKEPEEGDESDFEGFSDTEEYDDDDEIPLAELVALSKD